MGKEECHRQGCVLVMVVYNVLWMVPDFPLC